MIELLSALDRWCFVAINSGLANAVGDVVWPVITDYDRVLPIRIVLVCIWLALMIRGGTRGRTAALLVIVMLVVSDQLSSSVLKSMFLRTRPCHMANGIPAVQPLHLLVSCGPGTSFPSSHAVNNFAVATLFAMYYRRYRLYFYSWASLIALSRIAVGVHYPFDALGGAVIGTVVGVAIVSLWQYIARFLPAGWRVLPDEPSSTTDKQDA